VVESLPRDVEAILGVKYIETDRPSCITALALAIEAQLRKPYEESAPAGMPETPPLPEEEEVIYGE
jgi:hypothetical protein